MGPTNTRYSLKSGEVFKGGTPSRILQLINLYTDIGLLVVPLSEWTVAQCEISKKGTALNQAYLRVESGEAFCGRSSRDPIEDHDVPNYQKVLYKTPVPSMLYKSDGTKVNTADFYGPNGLKVDLSGGSVEVQEEFTFASAVTTTGSKQYTGIGAKTITITFDKSDEATDAMFTFWLVSSGKKYPLEGFRVTTPMSVVTIGKPGEIISIDKPAGVTFELQWTAAIGGGNVSAKATVS